ncbi:hypothetical protein HQ533_03005 [Candidatus Woesearchaeota archaeon]|nr:hypothetical protein [Candidatus Woesearchaeota archaeon]
MYKKAQAAIEFLMTYGWAILVLLAVIGALSYFGVLDASVLLPERCQFPVGFDCIGKASIDATSDSVRFIVQNSYGSRIIVDTITISADGDCTGTWGMCEGKGCTNFAASPLTLSNNERATIRLNCTNGISEGRFRTDVTILYNDTLTTFQFKAPGQIRGKAIE